MTFLIKCFRGSSSSSSASTTQPSTTVEHLCHRFSLAQLGKWTDDFSESRKIGGGPYGVAYRASISINGQLKDVAIKRLRPEAKNSSYGGLLLYKNDILFTCQLNHPNLLSLVGFCDDENEMLVVHEYAPNGSLHHQLYNSPTLSWKRRLEISIGVARGLHYLHSGTKRTIIHGDIVPITIMLDENWVPKLTFFGLSRKAPKSRAKNVVRRKELESVEGSVGSGKCLHVPNNLPHKSDVYSFGELLLELIYTFQIISQQQVRHLGETGKGEGIIDERFAGEIAPQCWKLFMDIAGSCLSEDPNDRPDMGEVEVQLEHVLEMQVEADVNHMLA